MKCLLCLEEMRVVDFGLANPYFEHVKFHNIEERNSKGYVKQYYCPLPAYYVTEAFVAGEYVVDKDVWFHLKDKFYETNNM